MWRGAVGPTRGGLITKGTHSNWIIGDSWVNYFKDFDLRLAGPEWPVLGLVLGLVGLSGPSPRGGHLVDK